MKPDKIIIKRPKYTIPDRCQNKTGKFAEKFARTLNLGYSISIVVVGKRTGISKTWSTASLASQFDPVGFGPQEVEDNHYCFYAKHYIPALRNLDFFRWIIFDEPGRKGSGGSRHEWQSEVNRAMSSTAQISRFRVPVSAFVIPHRAFISTQLFGLAQLFFVFKERGVCKVYRVEVSEFDGKIYTPYECQLHISFPDEDLIAAMEERKSKMFDIDTDLWTKGIIRSERKLMPPEDIAANIIDEKKVPKVVSLDKSGVLSFDAKLIARETSVGLTKAYQIKRALDESMDPTDNA